MLQKHSNPYTYVTGLIIPAIRIINGTKEVMGQTISDEYLVEADNYTRVYIGQARRDVIFSLSPQARDIYLMILYFMNNDYEFVVLTYEKVNGLYLSKGAKRPLGERKLKRIVKELVNMNILDLKDRENEHYWINPTYFFNGDRAKKWPGNVVVKRIINRSSMYDSIRS